MEIHLFVKYLLTVCLIGHKKPFEGDSYRARLELDNQQQ